MSASATPGGRERGISVDSVSHQFRNEKVLENIKFQVTLGSIVALLGPSGCGKTTLLRCLAGLINPSFGHIRLDGVRPADARHSGDIGFAFQSPTLLPWRTVLQNVLLPTEILKPSQNGASNGFALELLNLVELNQEAKKYPHELSGGMQQRVGLARSLITHPPFLFLDEPFGQLDGTTRDHLNEKLRTLWKRFHFTSVLVTHSIEEAVFLADQILIMSPKPSVITESVLVPFGESREPSIRVSQEFFDLTRQIRNKTRRFL